MLILYTPWCLQKKIDSNQMLGFSDVQQALDILRGSVMIVYPMGLPPHDPIQMELENKEELEGTQAALDVRHSWEGRV